jgi:hypothetical protein
VDICLANIYKLAYQLKPLDGQEAGGGLGTYEKVQMAAYSHSCMSRRHFARWEWDARGMRAELLVLASPNLTPLDWPEGQPWRVPPVPQLSRPYDSHDRRMWCTRQCLDKGTRYNYRHSLSIVPRGVIGSRSPKSASHPRTSRLVPACPASRIRACTTV